MYENQKMESVDPISLMEGLIAAIESDFSKRGIRIFTSFDSRATKCSADPRTLHQVFLSLLSNAADAVEGKSDANIFIGVSRVGETIQIKVVDNGAGMDERQQKDFFRPGIQKLMASTSGGISIESALEMGTEVSLLLEARND